MNDMANVDMDSLLDGTLDDLSDMPEFKPFAAGAHRGTINWEVKQVGTIPSVELKMTVLETMELKNPEDTPPAAGDTSTVLFMLKDKNGKKNELGEGQWKNVLAAIKPAFPDAATTRALMEASQGLEVLFVTGQRKDKKEATKIYTSLESITLL